MSACGKGDTRSTSSSFIGYAHEAVIANASAVIVRHEDAFFPGSPGTGQNHLAQATGAAESL
jgi:DNA replication protein DnaC